MALSRLAAEFAAEIKLHDWSDSPYRADRAGHSRDMDGNNPTIPQLTPEQTESVRVNAMWVAAQVLAYADPNFDAHEFARACGVSRKYLYNRRGEESAAIDAGLRKDTAGAFHHPGTYSSTTGNVAAVTA